MHDVVAWTIQGLLQLVGLSFTTFRFPIIYKSAKRPFIVDAMVAGWCIGNVAFVLFVLHFTWVVSIVLQWSSEKAMFSNTCFFLQCSLVANGGSSTLRSIVLHFFSVDCFDPRKHQQRSLSIRRHTIPNSKGCLFFMTTFFPEIRVHGDTGNSRKQR